MQLKEGKCDYCNRKIVGYLSYEGLHHVCAVHKEQIEAFARKGLIRLRFFEALKTMGK